MTLRHFLDAAHALVVEGYQQAGINLFNALDSAAAWGAKRDSPEEGSEDVVAAQNEASLQQLNALMAGVKRV